MLSPLSLSHQLLNKIYLIEIPLWRVLYMNKINYDFSAFIEVFNRMKVSGTVTPNDLDCIKKEFNRFFDDCDCPCRIQQ